LDTVAVDERTRHELHTRAAEVLGAEHAETLMSMLPPVGWADVATRRDLDALQTTLQQDMALLRAELRSDLHDQIGTLRSDLHDQIGTLRSDLHDQIGTLRSDLYDQIGTVRRDLHGEIGSVRSDMQAMTRTYILGNVGLVFTVAAIAFGAARLV
jgi:hypothetical protein